MGVYADVCHSSSRQKEIQEESEDTQRQNKGWREKRAAKRGDGKGRQKWREKREPQNTEAATIFITSDSQSALPPQNMNGVLTSLL